MAKLQSKVECRNCGHQDQINVRSNGEPIFPYVCTKCLNPWFRKIQSLNCPACGEEAKLDRYSGLCVTCSAEEESYEGLYS